MQKPSVNNPIYAVKDGKRNEQAGRTPRMRGLPGLKLEEKAAGFAYAEGRRLVIGKCEVFLAIYNALCGHGVPAASPQRDAVG